MPIVLVQGRIAVQFVELLKARIDHSWKINVWDPENNSKDEFVSMAYESDVIIGGKIPTDTWPKTPNLKLFQIPWTGYDFCSPKTMPLGVPICNCFEHETTIAEFVLCAILESKIKMQTIDKRFRNEGWGGRQPGMAINHGEVRGATLGIIGYGHIGEEVAKRAKSFGMRIIGVRRSKQAKPEWLDWLGAPDNLHELLSESDFIVVACDLNSETNGLIGNEEFSKMKSNSIIINIARGRVIQEEPFYNALKNKLIGGAVIDVWYNYIGPEKKEVWPCNYPFERLDNVILSGHESASSAEQIERRWDFVASNLERVMNNQPLKNKIFDGGSPE